MIPRWKIELYLAFALLAFGLVVLPASIYVVGQRVVGNYDGGGMMELAIEIWRGLLDGRWYAWTLVLSPYVVVQLLRLSWRVLRRGRGAASRQEA